MKHIFDLKLKTMEAKHFKMEKGLIFSAQTSQCSSCTSFWSTCITWEWTSKGLTWVTKKRWVKYQEATHVRNKFFRRPAAAREDDHHHLVFTIDFEQTTWHTYNTQYRPYKINWIADNIRWPLWDGPSSISFSIRHFCRPHGTTKVYDTGW